MRLGFTSFIYRYAIGTPEFPAARPLDPFGVLERAAAQGAQVVQYCENLPLDALDRAQLVRLLRRAAELGVAVEVGTRGTDIAHLKRQVDLAERVGGRHLRVVLGESDAQVVEHTLAALAPHLHQRGITLAIENHADLPGPALASILQRLNDPALGTCLDTANSLGLLEMPGQTAAALAPFVVQVHLKDYAVDKAPIGYHITGRQLGQGWLNLRGLLRRVQAAGRLFDVYLEQWMDPLPTLEATLAEEERWIGEGLRVARGLLMELQQMPGA